MSTKKLTFKAIEDFLKKHHVVHTNGDWVCGRFYRLYGDPVYIESWRMHETQPDGFCAWAEKRES